MASFSVLGTKHSLFVLVLYRQAKSDTERQSVWSSPLDFTLQVVENFSLNNREELMNLIIQYSLTDCLLHTILVMHSGSSKTGHEDKKEKRS